MMRPAVVCLLVLFAVPTLAADRGRVKVGSVEPYGAGIADYAAGPMAAGASRTETISVPGAAFVRVHFRRLRLAPGDSLTVARPDGGDATRYTDGGPYGNGQFWSFSVDGDTAVLTLETAGSARPGRGFGYEVDSVVRGDAAWAQAEGDGVSIESVCGDNGMENVACRLNEINAAQRPVARLNFVNNGGSYVCTGSLVRGANASTLLTNNHCFASQAATQTVEARFNYQTTTCTGTTLASYSRYGGGTFLRTSSALDYTLITLLGSPEATWGELVPSNRTVAVGTPIWLIQHPGGQPKKIGYWEDAAKTRRCDVETVNVTVSGYASGSQMGYSCDTEGGSSGSPVILANSIEVIGLHHLGGCRNSGTHMTRVCTDAGSLLQCGTGTVTPTPTPTPRARVTPTPTPTPTPSTPTATPTPGGFSGYYRLMARHSGKAVTVQSASTANSANVVQWTYGGTTTNDEWQVLSIGSGYFRVINRHSGRDLVVQSASTADGANIFQYAYGGTTTNDEWALVSLGNGYHRITNRHSGKSAEVVSGSTADGGNVAQRTYGGLTHQQFQIVSVP